MLADQDKGERRIRCRCFRQRARLRGAARQRDVVRAFAGELFGPGQPLDAGKYFIILPDALGTGKSTRPSNGLKMKFPNYDYADMKVPVLARMAAKRRVGYQAIGY